MAKVGVKGLNDIGNQLKNTASDLLSNSDFISRTIGMNNSYNDIMFLVQLLGREPISLLGKDYSYIYDNVRRNYLQGTEVMSKLYGSNEYTSCPKFTFYKEKPTIRFADPYNDPMNLLDRWESSFKTVDTSVRETSLHYSESNDGYTNNKSISNKSDLDNANPGTAHGIIESYIPDLQYCDMVGKTNSNFNHGKYKTLIARFHTNSDDSKSQTDSTQSANTTKYGMSHGRNLLRVNHSDQEGSNGYDNPYCRVWTYHHQYNQIKRQIRPLSEAFTAVNLESLEDTGDGVSFRRIGDRESGFDGASKRLDDYGVLNYRNNMPIIAPTAKIKDYFDHKENDSEKQTFSTKRCMFSIENLAWRDIKAKNDEYDTYGLSPEQRGPLGGRIMWFPPYDLQFNESVNVDWNQNKFIGRGEKVYTYTDTERRGNLSFTMIIDHPSILDYWTGLDRNGMKNQGLQLSKGNSGGVDNVNNQEQTLLRFFAGCDVLTAAPQKYEIGKNTPNEEKPKKVQNKDVPPSENAESKKGKIYCMLYYPNNYSGKDDDPEFAINYLMFGKGTQQITQKESVSGKWVTRASDPNIEDRLGYEVGDSGISIVTWDDVKDIEKYGVLQEGVSEYIQAKDGNTYYAKQIGSTASKGVDTTRITSEWKMKRWYYRVDKSTANQRLKGKPNNYIDGKSWKLNSTGYDWVKSNIKSFNLTNEDELVSFTDLYVALNEGYDEYLAHDKDNVEKIRKIANEEDGYKVIKLSFRGHNSSHGRNSKKNVNKSRNKTLSSSRALTFKKWLTKMNFPMAIDANADETLSQSTEGNTHMTDDVNNQYVKAWRSACVIIEYEKSDVLSASTAESTKVDESGQQLTDKVEIKNKDKSSDSLSSSDSNDYTVLNSNDNTVRRYDNEGEFFETLTNDAPFLHHLISEKIKYFDPAFHSISPEGFNARLTFLHQCTRQGSTVENNALDASTAYNLAFGRPPVCVLRIGDFYYTKIIINSLNIQYETPQWDLNPEGIGVMPMFAKINIDFAFIGGSDLSGPIARLQNAVSFNYYANTSVYDDRAEMVEYENNGSGNEVKFKGWNYPSDKSSKK